MILHFYGTINNQYLQQGSRQESLEKATRRRCSVLVTQRSRFLTDALDHLPGRELDDDEYIPEILDEEISRQGSCGLKMEEPYLSSMGLLLVNFTHSLKNYKIYAYSDFYKTDPIHLTQIIRCLEYLKDRAWVDISSIDVWLLLVWNSIPEPSAIYIPSVYMNPIEHESKSNTKEVINGFRQMFGLPQRGESCPLQTLLYVLDCRQDIRKTENYFCVVIFEPTKGAIYLLGRDISQNRREADSEDWESWSGRRVWEKVVDLMGWHKALSGSVTLQTIDWIQNGYDSGLNACEVAQHILYNGLKLDSSGWCRLPRFPPCYHPLRLKIAHGAHKWVVDGVAKLEGFELQFGRYTIQDYQELINMIKPNPVSSLAGVQDNLFKAMRDCNSCGGKSGENLLDKLARHIQGAELMKNDVQNPSPTLRKGWSSGVDRKGRIFRSIFTKILRHPNGSLRTQRWIFLGTL